LLNQEFCMKIPGYKKLLISILFLLFSLTFSLFAELYEPYEKSSVAPLSTEQFQDMLDTRVEKHACMKKSEYYLDRIKYNMYQSWTEPTLNQLKYDVLHYEINIGLDFNNAFISGSATTTFECLEDGLASIDLNLGYIYNVSQVVLNDSINLSYNQTEWFLLTGNLPAPMDSGEVASMEVFYSGYPNDWGAMQFTYLYGSDLCYTSVEPFDARFWWPCKDFPYDKPDSADIIITHPAGYTLVSNGLLQGITDNGNGTSTTHWHEKYPITTYLITIGCAEYERFDQSWEYESGQFLPIVGYYLPDAPPTATWSSAYYFENYTIPSLEALSYYYTLYPFIDEKYGHNHYNWGGAMEHQTLTSIMPNFNSEWVIAHECAHQWGGDLVTCHNFHHMWLNEGFASYSEVLYIKYHYGDDFARAWLDSQKHLNAGTPYVEDLENDNVFDGTTVYDKGSWVFYMLHMILGDDNFRIAMDQYFHDPELEFGTAYTSDLQRVCENVYGAPMGWFFDRWVYYDGNPAYEYSYMSEENTKDGNYAISMFIDQIQSYLPFTMPIEVTAFYGGTDTTFTVFNNLRSQLFQFELPQAPTQILIDPNEKILREVVFDPEFKVHVIGKELADANVGTPYQVDFESIGGTPPFTWSKASGQIPYGLTFNAGSNPNLNGIPTYASSFNFALKVEDSSDPVQSSQFTFNLTVNPPLPICGDLNTDQTVNISDIVYLINYIYLNGTEPDNELKADVNCDGKISLTDVIYLVNYVFRGGADPCADCPM